MVSNKVKRYVFNLKDRDSLHQEFAISVNDFSVIIDRYLNQELFVRRWSDLYECSHYLSFSPISSDVFEQLSLKCKLEVAKRRYFIQDTDDYLLYEDIIDTPLQLLIITIESKGHRILTFGDLFGVEKVECSLNDWNLFKRKIGICGSAGSGKTELAKILTHQLNIEFDANSFHPLEYCTTFIQKYGIIPSLEDEFLIWYYTKEREEVAALRADIICSDCPTFLTYIYAVVNHDASTDKAKIYLSKLYKKALSGLSSYTDMIYLRRRNVVKDNKIRFELDETSNILVDLEIKRFLDIHNVKHTESFNPNADDFIKQLFYINEVK